MSQTIMEAEINPLGYYSAATNTPRLYDGVGTQGDFYISEDTGTVDFGHGPVNIKKDELVLLSRGLIWKVVPTTDQAPTGVTIGILDSSTPKSQNGATVVGSNSLVLQTADNTAPGLVSTAPQVMRGQKTFPEGVVANVTGVASGNAVIQGLSQYSMLAMDVANNLTEIKPNADISQVLCSNGIGSYPSFRNLTTNDFFPNGIITAKALILTGAPTGTTLSVTGTGTVTGALSSSTSITSPIAIISGQATVGSLVANGSIVTESLLVNTNATISGDLTVLGNVAFNDISVINLAAKNVNVQTLLSAPVVNTNNINVSEGVITGALSATGNTILNTVTATTGTATTLNVSTTANVPTLITPLPDSTYTGQEAINLNTLSAIAETGGANFGLYAKLLSPLFEGNPQAPTPALGDFSNLIATTEYVGGTYDFDEGYIILPTGFCIQWGVDAVNIATVSTLTVNLPIKLSSTFIVIPTQQTGSATTIGAKFNGLSQVDLQNVSGADVFGCNYVALGYVNFKQLWNLVPNAIFSNAAFINGQWLGYRNGIYWSDDGKTWNETNRPSNLIMDIQYNDGVYVAIGNDDRDFNNGISYSVDGKTWTLSDFTENSKILVYANNTWVAATDIGVYYSTGAATWLASNNTFASRVLLNNNGTWVSHGSGELLMSSPDGITWTVSNIPNETALNVIFANNTWVVRDVVTNLLWYSTDGVTWVETTNVTTATVLFYDNGMWHVAGDTGIQSSVDGINWVQSSITTLIIQLAYANGLYVANGVDGVVTSPDGLTWTANATAMGVKGLVYADNVWVAYGELGIFVSADGVNFTQTNISQETSLLSFNNNLWVSGIRGDSLLYSTNAERWESASVQGFLNGIAYNNGVWVVSTSDGVYWSTGL